MTTVMARRVFDYQPKRGPSRKVRVDVGRPARGPKGWDWYCPYQIVGLGNDKVIRAHGIDALQALILALAGISQEVTERGKRDPALTWLGDRWLGLQVHCVFRADGQHILDAIKRRKIKVPRDLQRRLVKEMRSLP